MKTTYLLPHKYKTLGWVLLIIGIILGIILTIEEYESNLLTTRVFSIFNGFNNYSFFSIEENSLFDELITAFIIIGGLIVGFSREKVEDEYIYKLRKDSLVWAIITNYAVLLILTLIVYEMAYFHVLIYNMFTPLLFFIIRFNFLKHKSEENDE